jgi:hypothetical protein
LRPKNAIVKFPCQSAAERKPLVERENARGRWLSGFRV